MWLYVASLKWHEVCSPQLTQTHHGYVRATDYTQLHWQSKCGSIARAPHHNLLRNLVHELSRGLPYCWWELSSSGKLTDRMSFLSGIADVAQLEFLLGPVEDRAQNLVVTHRLRTLANDIEHSCILFLCLTLGGTPLSADVVVFVDVVMICIPKVTFGVRPLTYNNVHVRGTDFTQLRWKSKCARGYPYYHSTVVLRNLVHEFSWWELSNFGKLTNHMSFHPESQM